MKDTATKSATSQICKTLAVIAAGHHKRKNLTKYLEFKIQKSDFGRQKNKKIFTKIYRPY